MKINTAESEIAAILRDFEIANGVVVRGVTINDTEVTCVDSNRPEWSRYVHIEFDHVPGTNWVQAKQALS